MNEPPRKRLKRVESFQLLAVLQERREELENGKIGAKDAALYASQKLGKVFTVEHVRGVADDAGIRIVKQRHDGRWRGKVIRYRELLERIEKLESTVGKLQVELGIKKIDSAVHSSIAASRN